MLVRGVMTGSGDFFKEESSVYSYLRFNDDAA